jgi:hypothetical protein
MEILFSRNAMIEALLAAMMGFPGLRFMGFFPIITQAHL